MSDDTIPYVTTNGHKPITRLSALDKIFTATGEVTIQCGARQLTLPLQTVDLEFVEALCKPYKPVPKVLLALENGVRTRTRDLHDDAYQDALAVYNRLQSYAYVLASLMCDIEDKQGKVVWSADNSIHDLEAGRQALRDAGIVDAQLAAILTAATELTKVVEEKQLSD